MLHDACFYFYRYAHYDNSPSFSDWRSFGAWTRPAIKQFNDGPAVCGAKSDKRAHSAAQPAASALAAHLSSRSHPFAVYPTLCDRALCSIDHNWYA